MAGSSPTMQSWGIMSFTFCILACICSLQQSVVTASKTATSPLHLTYYVQEFQGGPNTTLIAAAGTGQGNLSAVDWGSFLVFDNALTAGPQAYSLLLGKATGTAIVTTPGGVAAGGVLLTVRHIFGKGSMYRGASITILGTFLYPLPGPWELQVLGGTGSLRGYSGYGLAESVAEYTVPPLFVFKWNIYLSK